MLPLFGESFGTLRIRVPSNSAQPETFKGDPTWGSDGFRVRVRVRVESGERERLPVTEMREVESIWSEAEFETVSPLSTPRQ